MKRRPDPWRGILPAVALLALVSCSAEPRADVPAQGAGQVAPPSAHRREVVQPEGLARLPVFSTAIRNGDVLWMSGQIGTLPGVSPPTLV